MKSGDIIENIKTGKRYICWGLSYAGHNLVMVDYHCIKAGTNRIRWQGLKTGPLENFRVVND